MRLKISAVAQSSSSSRLPDSHVVGGCPLVARNPARRRRGASVGGTFLFPSHKLRVTPYVNLGNLWLRKFSVLASSWQKKSRHFIKYFLFLIAIMT